MLQETVPTKEWMLESRIYISSEFGDAEAILHLYCNKDVYIIDFAPSAGNDGINNPDIRYLSFWAQESGWNIPQPFPDLVRLNFDFWKHFWGAGIVNSNFLDKKLGEREGFDDDQSDNNYVTIDGNSEDNVK
jgi:hypothetical protein